MPKKRVEPERKCGARAIVVGYGPVGQTIVHLLDRFEVWTTVIELNIDTISELRERGRTAIYGDGRREEVLHAAGIEAADYVLVTIPDPATRAAVVETVRSLSATVQILVRAHYLAERDTFQVHEKTVACYEEQEVAVRLAEMILGEMGLSRPQIEWEARRIWGELERDERH